jgi:hypothetical protein
MFGDEQETDAAEASEQQDGESEEDGLAVPDFLR